MCEIEDLFVSFRDLSVWTMRSGRPHASWLRQVEFYLMDIDMTDLVSVWAMARRGLSQGYGHNGPAVCLGNGQTEAHLKDMDMTGLVSIWAMARRRHISRIWT